MPSCISRCRKIFNLNTRSMKPNAPGDRLRRNMFSPETDRCARRMYCACWTSTCTKAYSGRASDSIFSPRHSRYSNYEPYATDVGNEEYRSSHGASYALGRATNYRMLGSNVAKYITFRFRFEAVLVLHALGDMCCIDTRSGTPCARTSSSSACW